MRYLPLPGRSYQLPKVNLREREQGEENGYEECATGTNYSVLDAVSSYEEMVAECVVVCDVCLWRGKEEGKFQSEASSAASWQNTSSLHMASLPYLPLRLRRK